MILKFKMLIIALSFGFVVIGSLFAQTDNRLNGRWITVQDDITMEYRFNNGNFEDSTNGLSYRRGTYTVSNGNINLNYTHMHGDSFNFIFNELGISFSKLDSKWHTLNEVILAVRPIFIGLGFSERDVNNAIHSMMTSNQSVPYSVDTNTLILTFSEGNERTVLIFNKR